MRNMPEPYNTLRSQTGSFYEVEAVCGNRSYDIYDIYDLSIGQRLFEGSGPAIGNACAATCRLRVKESSANWPRMAAFTLRLRLSSEDGQTKAGWLPMGTWYTDTRSETENGFLTIEAFDGMLKTEQFWTDVVPEEDLPANWPITAKAWLDMIADAGLVTLDSRNVIDNTVAFIGLDTTATVRDVLKTIAASHGGNWVMTFENKLRLVPLQNAGDTGADSVIIGMRAQSLDSSPALAEVSGVRLETDGGTVISAGTTAGYVLQAQCNFADSDGVAALCLGRTQGYVYKPFAAGRANLDPAAEIGDIAAIGQESFQMMSVDWNIRTWPTADIAAAFEEEVNHEYNYLDESAKNYRKSMRYTDEKADDLQEEIVAAETAIEQTAEAVALTAQAVGAERVTESVNLIRYPFSEQQVVTISGLRFTYNYDGSVAVDGTATASVYTGFSGETELESGTYTFSVETPLDFNPDSSYTVPLRVKVGSTTFSLSTVTERNGKKIYSTNVSVSGNAGFILAVNSGETVHAVLYPQVASGSTLLDWEPPVGAAVSNRLSQLQASLRVTAQGIFSEVSRATAAEAALIADVDVEYAKGTSSTVAPTSGWSTDTPVWEEGKYIWQRTKTVSGSGTATYSNPTCIQGAAATAYSLQVSHAVILNEGGESYDPASITLSAKQQSGSASMTSYAGRFKIETTADGSSWTSRYTSSSNESSKSYTIPTNITFTAIRCSLYAAGGTSILLDQEILPLISEGAQGEDGYTVVLTNSNHTFAGGTTAAIATSTDCGVIAYKGATQMAVTIGTISGKPTGMSTSISGSGTTNAKFTVSVTTSMTSRNGTLTIPVTVDGKSFSMTFTYSLALVGETGDNGIGVSEVVEQYYLSNSSTTPTGGSWETNQPVWESGKYIWTRSKVTWTDSTVTYTTPVLAQAINGANETAYEVDQEQNYTVTKSKNLAPYLYGQESYSESGVTVTFLENGSIKVTGTATATKYLRYIYTPFSLTDGTYCLMVEAPSNFPTVSGDPSAFSLGEVSDGGYTLRMRYPNYTHVQSAGNTMYYQSFDVTGCDSFILQINISNGSTYNHVIYPQIVRGEDVMPWSPPVGANVRLAEQMKYADSQITQTADGISMTVKKGNVISSINQSAEAITINANRLNLTGYITATDVSATGSTVINGSRISGGTLTLGGSENGNGVLKIKNASGTDIVVGDKDGLRVTGGIIDGGNIDGATIIGTVIEFRGGTYGQKLRMSSESSVGNVSVYRIKADYSGYGILNIYADSGSTYGYSAFGVYTNSSGGIELDCDSYSIRMDSSGIQFYRGGTLLDSWT